MGSSSQQENNILSHLLRGADTLMKHLLNLKIERELRTSYIVEAKKAETFAKALVAKLPRLSNAWGQEN